MTQNEKLLAALKLAVKIAGDAFDAWDRDDDMRCGKILRYLGDPKLSGYRLDIDSVHDAIREAEEAHDDVAARWAAVGQALRQPSSPGSLCNRCFTYPHQPACPMNPHWEKFK